MKNLKKILITTVFLIVVLFSNNVFADEGESESETSTKNWTDFTNAKVVINQKEDLSYWNYRMDLTGVTLDTEASYAVIFKNDSNNPDKPTSWDNFNESADVLIDDNKVEDIDVTSVLDRCYENSGDVYCYIIQGYSDGNIGDYYKTKIERLNQHSLGNRIKCYFHNDDTSTFFYEAHNDSINNEENRSIKLKIGTISDSNILLSIKNGETGCLEKLMTYAKSASSPIYTGTVPLGKSDSITSNLNIINEEYYYVYMEMDDENGKYYPVEDVSLYQGLVDESIGKNLYDYLDSNFKWNINNGEPASTNISTDTTTATTGIPKAGIKTVLVVILIAGVLSIIFYNKKNKWKGID